MDAGQRIACSGSELISRFVTLTSASRQRLEVDRNRQMNPSLATVVYALGILSLFYLNRDTSVQTSRALWIPVIWLWILGSRAASSWLGITSGYSTNAMPGNVLLAFSVDGK